MSIKKTIYILSGLLFVFAFFMLVLYGASGHQISLNAPGTLIYLGLMMLYSSTALVLLCFIKRSNQPLKVAAIALMFMSVLSFIYFFYELLKVKIGDLAILIPVVLLLSIAALCITVIYALAFKRVSI